MIFNEVFPVQYLLKERFDSVAQATTVLNRHSPVSKCLHFLAIINFYFIDYGIIFQNRFTLKSVIKCRTGFIDQCSAISASFM